MAAMKGNETGNSLFLASQGLNCWLKIATSHPLDKEAFVAMSKSVCVVAS